MAGKRKERANASSNVALSNLKIVLDKCGVNDNRYCFGVHIENKTSIVQENGVWTVSFFERGSCEPVAEYESATEACEKMIDTMVPHRLKNKIAKRKFHALMAKSPTI